MTSIPADPSLVLGNIIDPEKIDQLMAIAELQQPVDLATDRLNNLTMSSYKMGMIYQQMVNMGVDFVSLTAIQAEQIALKAELADAAIDLGHKVIESEKALRELKDKFAQTKISKQVESPMNYELSEVKPFPLSFDSLKFDVQFFQVMESEDSSQAHASSISAHVAKSFSSADDPSRTRSHAASAHDTAMSSSQNNTLEGTIVITASATHRQMDVLAPFVMDPQKAVNAWNYCNPKDKLKCNARDMWKAALKEEDGPKYSMQILTGCAKQSSFVGYVHILKTEGTDQSQETSSVAAAVARTMENEMGVSAQRGQFQASAQSSATVNSLLSTAKLTTNCSLQCMGVIPSIVSNTMETTVQNMNPDPATIMAQLGAIANAGSTDVNAGMESAASNATTGAQFISLNNEYLTNTVSALGEQTRMSNQIIDTNSMMTAFEDYVNKAIAGECGVPSAYFMKDLHKPDIAKCYIRRFYPNGAQNQKKAMAGQLGTTPEGGTAEE
eukprot:CAMPEP_0194228322 /NCGR_PEP_ID=MMETSP0156-20130528/43314_1 /TAXON_ID=33649 /ORGANISM="Thalassionema nitzschioides, Strain L26-B" /LENGTH=497 /DNA_ID=CAMNT_0038960833 /DNA_START=182 /DNA_END=1675 /DNA_ORIENTATION=+